MQSIAWIIRNSYSFVKHNLGKMSLLQISGNIAFVIPYESSSYNPFLLRAGGGEAELMALAEGSTIAGNLTILGAASNVIIIQNVERRKGMTITFLEFARVGVPLTILNGTVYWLFLRYL